MRAVRLRFARHRCDSRSLIMRGRVLAHHLIWTGYGHWLPNDPRGSGSAAIFKEELQKLGAIHFGRKKIQPRRSEVKEFYAEADQLLEHPRIQFTGEMIDVIAAAFGTTIQKRHYTCYACAALPDHAHLVIRAHRDDAETMIDELQKESRLALFDRELLPMDHPVWIDGGWKVFLGTVDQIRGRIRYVENNPKKEGLPAQHWPFVTAYDGWPYHKKK
jgi:hypothetical protein